MSENGKVLSNGEYKGFDDLIQFYNRKRKETPKGVSLKKDKHYIFLQFVFPDTGKRSSKACNCKLSDEGIIQAVSKAHKVKAALAKYSKASEFWEWYDKEILEVNTIENDLKTYRTIFSEIEDEYFKGRHSNTKRKRSREIKSDVDSFRRCYETFFSRFSKLDNYPSWADIQEVLFSWEQGTKQFKDAYFVLKRICSKSANAKALLEKMDEIDCEQTVFADKQSISIDSFLKWYTAELEKANKNSKIKQAEKQKAWLWVHAACVLYGLRPSEIAAGLNLEEPVTIDGIVFKAISQKDNSDLLLVLGDFTYFGSSIKTGGRICKPLVTDRKLIETLKIHEVNLPRTGSKRTGQFSDNSRQFRVRHNCPVTQGYAFRHLSNQLGEKYGIPQEIRARSLGHSTTINDKIYKSRSNTETTVDLLLNHKKQPLSYDAAIEALSRGGVDLHNSLVKQVLGTIYNY